MENTQKLENEVVEKEDLTFKIIVWIILVCAGIYLTAINRIVIKEGREVACYSGFELLTKKDYALQYDFFISKTSCETSPEVIASIFLMELSKYK